MDFERAIDKTLAWEGGYVFDISVIFRRLLC